MQTTSLQSFRGMRLAPAKQRLPVRQSMAHRCVVKASMAGGAASEDPYQVRQYLLLESSIAVLAHHHIFLAGSRHP